MSSKKQLRNHKGRRVTDLQIRVLQSWVPFKDLARAMGISVGYAKGLRDGKVQHKTSSP